MAALTSAKRNSLPDSTFALPEERKFPLNNASHARNALSRAGAQGGDVEAKVKAAVSRRFPAIEQKKKRTFGDAIMESGK